jgi:hypothetical protein
MKADIDLDIGRKTVASGPLPELIAALRRSRPGDLVVLPVRTKALALSCGPSHDHVCIRHIAEEPIAAGKVRSSGLIGQCHRVLESTRLIRSGRAPRVN